MVFLAICKHLIAKEVSPPAKSRSTWFNTGIDFVVVTRFQNAEYPSVSVFLRERPDSVRFVARAVQERVPAKGKNTVCRFVFPKVRNTALLARNNPSCRVHLLPCKVVSDPRMYLWGLGTWPLSLTGKKVSGSCKFKNTLFLLSSTSQQRSRLCPQSSPTLKQNYKSALRKKR